MSDYMLHGDGRHRERDASDSPSEYSLAPQWEPSSVAFGDLVMEDQCGPSMMPAPTTEYSTTLSPTSLDYVDQSLSLLPTNYDPMPSIAPAELTSNPTSPLPSATYSEQSFHQQVERAQPKSAPRSNPRSATRSAAQSTAASTSAENIATSSIIQNIVRPTTQIASTSSQLLLLGLPEEGARSRVETQVKLSLTLVTPKSTHNAQPVNAYRLPDGSIAPAAAAELDKVGTWRYVKLPTHSAIKRKSRKLYRTGIPPEQTLFLDVAVHKSTEPYDRVYICQNCRAREIKRAQRKNDARVRASDVEIENDPPPTEQDELNKIVVFNTGEFVDFDGGEIVVPTRITCYCRHHKERTGFNMLFSLRDHLGNLVTSTMSPSIFLTDDHKAKPISHTSSQTSRQPSITSSESVRSARNTRGVGGSSGMSASRSLSTDDDYEEEAKTSSRRAAASKPYAADTRSTSSRRSSVRRSVIAMTPLNQSASPSPPPYTAPGSGPNVLIPAANLMSMSNPDDFLQNFASHSLQNPQTSVPSSPASSSASYASHPLSGQLSQGSFESPYQNNGMLPSPQFHSPDSLISPYSALDSATLAPSLTMPSNQPLVRRLIPAEGPLHGGIEVTILGENFTAGCVVMFGDSPAIPTQYWSPNTLVCVLPPSPSPGPVVVSFKNIPLNMSAGGSLQFFTYLDNSDRSLMELALQVVGLKMTGRVEDARNVAMRIVGSQHNGGHSQGQQMPSQASMHMQHSLQASIAAIFSQAAKTSQVPSSQTTNDFQAIVIKLLQLLDLDNDEVDGAAFHRFGAEYINRRNGEHHNLLHLAVILGFHRLVAFLLERRIDINARDKNGYTPLHFAALSGRVTVTRLLLQANAGTFIRNNMGYTALALAKQRDQVDLVPLFASIRNEISCKSSRSSLPSFASDAVSYESDSWDEDEDEEDRRPSDLESHLSRNASAISAHSDDNKKEGEALTVADLAEASSTWVTIPPTLVARLPSVPNFSSLLSKIAPKSSFSSSNTPDAMPRAEKDTQTWRLKSWRQGVSNAMDSPSKKRRSQEEQVVEETSTYDYHLQHDWMLYYFWLPILLCAMVWLGWNGILILPGSLRMLNLHV